jgi:hypothetical protein
MLPDLNTVLSSAAVQGALTSVLGKGYAMHGEVVCSSGLREHLKNVQNAHRLLRFAHCLRSPPNDSCYILYLTCSLLALGIYMLFKSTPVYACINRRE